jgi:hypothetical protein
MYQRSQQAIFSEVGSDIVALNVERGSCYGMEEVTATVWQLLSDPQTLEQICSRLVEIYEVDPETCKVDVQALIGDLESEGLIQRSDGAAA